MFVVIDEAHCITQWGEKFRKMYSNLHKLCSYVPAGTPLLITSATLPPPTLSEIRNTLEVHKGQSYDLNLGNDRSNITPIIWPMRAAKEDLDSLNFVVTAWKVPPRTVIYVNEKELARKACEHLWKLVTPEKRPEIDFIHAGRSPGPQKAVLKQFQEGKVSILCATEVVGMVRPKISKLDVLMQRLPIGDRPQERHLDCAIHGPILIVRLDPTCWESRAIWLSIMCSLALRTICCQENQHTHTRGP